MPRRKKWYFTWWLFIYSTFASTEAGLHFAHHPMIRGYKAHIQVFVSWFKRLFFFREYHTLCNWFKIPKNFITISFFFWAGPDILVFGFHAIRNKRIRKNRFWPMYISLQINLVVFIHVHLPLYFHLPNLEFINHMI